MKFALAALVFAAFTSIAVFGILSMNHGSMQSHNGGCIVALAENVDCIAQANALEYLAAHFSLFQSFTSAMADSNFAFIVALFFFAAFFTFVGIIHLRAPIGERARTLARSQTSRSSLPTQKFTRFLSLLETSPTFV